MSEQAKARGEAAAGPPAGPARPARAGRLTLGTGPRGQVRRGSYGFTLIEILIVLGIATLLVGSVVSGLGASRRAEVARATNQLANTVRFAFNKARVTGMYYRLHMNLEKGEFTLQRGDDRMYLPATDRYGRMVVVDPGKEKEKADRDRRAEENYNRSLQARVMEAVRGAPAGSMQQPGVVGQQPGAPKPGQPPAPAAAKPPVPGQPPLPGQPGQPGQSMSTIDKYAGQAKKVPRRKPPLFGAFEDDNSLSELRKPFKLPPEVKIVSVRTADDVKPITKGEASLYFFPQGHTQLAHIHVQEKEAPENEFTIIVKPLTGRVEIVDGKVDLVIDNDPTAIRDDLGKKLNRRTF